MEIANPKIEDYILTHIANRETIFKEMESYATKVDFPIVGPMVGQILMQLTKMLKAKRILELGSGFGYSAIWFDKGMEEGGEIICTDFSKENELLATKNFELANMRSTIQFHVEDALEILSKLEGDFDIIFNDVDKEEYPETYEASIPRLKKGGILVTDNTLWYGKVVDSNSLDGATTGVIEYNRKAFSDKRVISVLLPVRDGLTISLKI